MAGNKAGGIKATKTNKERYGEDYYHKLGAKGGKVSSNREWTLTPEGHKHMVEVGGKGGKNSKPYSKKAPPWWVTLKRDQFENE